MMCSKQLADLETYGIVDCPPTSPEAPLVYSPVLISNDSEVFLPPLRFEDDVLVEAGAVVTRSEFDISSRDGLCMALRREPARADGCFYQVEGCSRPMYVSHETAAKMLREFSDRKIEAGDHLLIEALDQYALAASAVQTPRCYARMLLVPMPQRREQRIRDALQQVGGLQVHIESARAAIASLAADIILRRERP
jgi:hypothetical protein